jgi:anti-sigma factor RsiW
MNCEETRARLGRMVEGSMDGEAARAVREHLASCRACAALLSPADLVEILPALDETVEPTDTLPAGFHSRLMEHRRAATAPPVPWWEGLFALPSAARLATAGGMAAFLFGVSYLGLQRITAPGTQQLTGDLAVAQNLPLLKDMEVVQNLELLEDFDTIQGLADKPSGSEAH